VMLTRFTRTPLVEITRSVIGGIELLVFIACLPSMILFIRSILYKCECVLFFVSGLVKAGFLIPQFQHQLDSQQFQAVFSKTIDVHIFFYIHIVIYTYMDYIFTLFPCFVIKEVVFRQKNVCLIITDLKDLNSHFARNAISVEKAD